MVRRVPRLTAVRAAPFRQWLGSGDLRSFARYIVRYNGRFKNKGVKIWFIALHLRLLLPFGRAFKARLVPALEPLDRQRCEYQTWSRYQH